EHFFKKLFEVEFELSFLKSFEEFLVEFGLLSIDSVSIIKTKKTARKLFFFHASFQTQSYGPVSTPDLICKAA
ncbi:MAG: hypothetical protein K2P84_04065, partial [Undibacterium sp.]|nr:hypothetical protein [Undibacterium sp.]